MSCRGVLLQDSAGIIFLKPLLLQGLRNLTFFLLRKTSVQFAEKVGGDRSKKRVHPSVSYEETKQKYSPAPQESPLPSPCEGQKDLVGAGEAATAPCWESCQPAAEQLPGTGKNHSTLRKCKVKTQVQRRKDKPDQALNKHEVKAATDTHPSSIRSTEARVGSQFTAPLRVRPGAAARTEPRPPKSKRSETPSPFPASKG